MPSYAIFSIGCSEGHGSQRARMICANDYTIDQLQKIINSEKVLFNFNIKCICNNILLKWC